MSIDIKIATFEQQIWYLMIGQLHIPQEFE